MNAVNVDDFIVQRDYPVLVTVRPSDHIADMLEGEESMPEYFITTEELEEEDE